MAREDVAHDVPPSSQPSLLTSLLVAARPKQWTKNVLVFAAPGAAGVLDNAEPLRQSIIAFVCFCLAASGTYYLNDASDVEADRLHPTKRFRPIASGAVPVGLAQVLGPLLIAAGIALSFAARWQLAVAVAGYVVLTTSYTYWLKHIAVVDVVAVAAGFVIRAIAGAAATGVPVSDWFFIVASFGSLFIVAGKRQAEADELGEGAIATRPALAEYSTSYLAYLRAVSSGTVLVAYCVWAFEKAQLSGSSVPWFQLSILPFVLGVLRYALLLDAGHGGAPEDLVLSDRALLVIGLAWGLVFGLGIYVG
jgi:decaprenyl-phosphate phosphoribosyltransferase